MNPGSGTASRAQSPGVDRVRRGGLALVMVGALSVSVRGQVQAVEPLLGGMSVVLALTNDLAALLALNELMSTQRRDVRRWAWAVLVLAGGTAAGLNTWHALQVGGLPPVWAVVVGIGPVLLAVVLSHLVALVLSDGPEPVAHPTGAGVVAATAGVDTVLPAGAGAPTVQAREPETPTPTEEPEVESARAVQEPATALDGPGVHPGLAVVPALRGLPVHLPSGDREGDRAQPQPARAAVGDPRVEQLAAQLRGGAALTGGSVAAQLGCSPRTGRRLLRQAEEHLIVSTDPGRTLSPSNATRGGGERGTG